MSPPAAQRRFRWRWSYLVWLAVPVLLWWSLRNIDLAEVGATLARLQAWQIATLLLVNVLTLLAFSGRYWFILRGQGYSIPFLTLTRYRIAVFGVSYFTSGLQFGGEPLQVYLVSRYHQVPGSVAVAATALDKMIELLVNFAVLAVGALAVVETRMFAGVAPEVVAGPVFALLALPAGFLASAWLGWKPLTWLLARLPGHVRDRPAFGRVFSSVEAAETQVTDFCRRQPGPFLWALAATAVSWAFILFEYWLGVAFLGVELTFTQLIGVMTLNRLAFLIPLPAGLGALETSLVMAFTALGFSPAVGVSQGVLVRARDVPLGLLGLWWAGRLVTKDDGWRTAVASPAAPAPHPTPIVNPGESDG